MEQPVVLLSQTFACWTEEQARLSLCRQVFRLRWSAETRRRHRRRRRRPLTAQSVPGTRLYVPSARPTGWNASPAPKAQYLAHRPFRPNTHRNKEKNKRKFSACFFPSQSFRILRQKPWRAIWFHSKNLFYFRNSSRLTEKSFEISFPSGQFGGGPPTGPLAGLLQVHATKWGYFRSMPPNGATLGPCHQIGPLQVHATKLGHFRSMPPNGATLGPCHQISSLVFSSTPKKFRLMVYTIFHYFAEKFSTWGGSGV